MCANTEFNKLFEPKNITPVKKMTSNKSTKITKGKNNSTNSDSRKNKSEMVNNDFLGISTAYTKDVCNWIGEFSSQLQNSTAYKILTRTTQPAHFIAILVMFGVGMLVYFPSEEESLEDNSDHKNHPLVALAYLTAFATHFGTQVWMTFVSGLALYFSLPRHTFGLCQEVLFPKYFAMNSVLSLITLVLFARSRNGHWDHDSMVQAGALGLCAFIEMTVRLYLAPPILKLMRAKNSIEATAGKGSEVGHIDAGNLTKCQYYMALQKAFRKVHMSAAIGNLVAMACTFLHLQYLASRIMVL